MWVLNTNVFLGLELLLCVRTTSLDHFHCFTKNITTLKQDVFNIKVSKLFKY